MLADHLNDEMIQDYLDGNLAGNSRAVFEQHAQECSECREAISMYREMYAGLEIESDFVLPKNFTRQVVRLTHKKQMGSIQFGLQQLFFALAFLIVGINITLYYIEPGQATTGVKDSIASAFQFLPALAGILGSLFQQAQIPGFYFIAIITILLVLFVIDKLVLQPRFRHAS